MPWRMIAPSLAIGLLIVASGGKAPVLGQAGSAAPAPGKPALEDLSWISGTSVRA